MILLLVFHGHHGSYLFSTSASSSVSVDLNRNIQFQLELELELKFEEIFVFCSLDTSEAVW